MRNQPPRAGCPDWPIGQTATLQDITRAQSGALILSTTEGGGGYYRAASADELRRYVQSMRSRSKETLAVIRKAEMILQQGDIDQ